MGIMRWRLYKNLKATYPNVSVTYGYITKNTRIRNNLEKTHTTDARCISGNPTSIPAEFYFIGKATRTHNRQIHKTQPGKCGYRKKNQLPKYVSGYQLYDKVRMPDKREGFIFGRRSTGSFDVRTLDGEKLSAGISYKKLGLLETRKTILTQQERRKAHSSPA
ncbi:hypothetical protein FACS1894187_05570 [Synergistales bacterium]|nr:hypothetical protein FACS1894187_05570 [Synergistales bacterium]